MKITLKALRVNAGLTQKQAASKVGVAPATLIRWEAGKTSPTVQQVADLAELYGCELSDIFMPSMLTKSE